MMCVFFFFSSRRRHTIFSRDWSSDVCSSDLSDASLEKLYAIDIASEGSSGIGATTGGVVVRRGTLSDGTRSPPPRRRRRRRSARSEERRVGNESSWRWAQQQ